MRAVSVSPTSNHTSNRASYTVEVQCDPAFASHLAHHLHTDELVRAAQATLRHKKVVRGEIAIAITDDETVQALNRQHRHLDAPTDILSFGSAPDGVESDGVESGSLKLVLPAELAEEMASFLGDLVVAYPYTQRQAARLGRSLADELRLLVVHGTLHLLGHDHATPAEEAAMWALQDEILAELAAEEAGVGEENAQANIQMNALMRKRHADRNFFTGRWFSFRAAVEGALHTLRSQPNAWIELAAVAVVSAAGAWLHITAAEWALLALTFGLILALEAVNTAVEATIDLVSPGYHPLAKIAKDAAAGALVFAMLASLAIAIAIFGSRLIAFL